MLAVRPRGNHGRAPRTVSPRGGPSSNQTRVAISGYRPPRWPTPRIAPTPLAGLLDKAVKNSRFTGEVVGQLEVAVPEVGMHAAGIEQRIRTPTGPATNLMVTSDAGANIMILAASGPDSNMWVWPELLALAATPSRPPELTPSLRW